MYKVLDLFSGAGGLSLGFEQTGKFKLVAAVENNINARKTYEFNHPNTKILGDICSIDFDKLKKDIGEIDVIIGGPPCQGFSNANRQKKQAISINNKLVKYYFKAIRKMNPKMFVMENVTAIQSKSHKFYYSDDPDLDEQTPMKLFQYDEIVIGGNENIDLDEFIINIDRNMNHLLIDKELFSMLKKINNRSQKMDDVSKEKLEKFITKNNIKIQKKLEKEIENKINLNDCFSEYILKNLQCIQKNGLEHSVLNSIKENIQNIIEFNDMILSNNEIVTNHIIVDKYSVSLDNKIIASVKSCSVIKYIKYIIKDKYVYVDGELNAATFGVPQKRSRYILIGKNNQFKNEMKLQLPKAIVSEDRYSTVFDAISDIEVYPPALNVSSPPIKLNKTTIEDKLLNLKDSDFLYNHIITKSREKSLNRFEILKEGQNFHDLSEKFKDTYAEPKKTQNSIYKRLKYDEPCDTVTNARKSMWIHPTQNRAISIREVARLQTFPDSFVFIGTKDSQYQQIGNAVPPIMAKKIAEQILKYIENEE